MLRLVKETRCYRLTQHLTLACKMPSNYFNNTSNQTNLNASFSYWPGYILLPSTLRYFQLSVQVFIAFFGIFGNVLVCITVSQRKSLRSTTNFYLLSLAVADIGVLMINFPLAIFKSYFIWPFGEAFCLYIYPMTDVFFGASIWSIAVIAIGKELLYNHSPFKNILPFETTRTKILCTVGAVVGVECFTFGSRYPFLLDNTVQQRTQCMLSSLAVRCNSFWHL